MKIEFVRHSANVGGEVVVWALGRRFRFALICGTPPGSHIGFWRTRGGFTGELSGVNLRIGRRYLGPALTLLAHTRRLRAGEP